MFGSTEILIKMETIIIDKSVYLEIKSWKIGEILFSDGSILLYFPEISFINWF